MVTVSVSAGLTTLPSLAVIALVPVATPVASPEEALIVATVAVADAQVTVLVRFCVELSV